jgi:hypothetical protein
MPVYLTETTELGISIIFSIGGLHNVQYRSGDLYLI